MQIETKKHNVINDLTAEQILAVSIDAPEKLFSGNLEIAKGEFYALSRRWHPDRSFHPQSTTVFQHIVEVYRKTQKLIKTNEWTGSGILKLPIDEADSAKSVARHLWYFKRTKFELGDVYIGGKKIAFSVEKQYADLFENARRKIAEFRFATHSMQSEIEFNLPHNAEYFSSDGRLLMVIPKIANAVRLDDLMRHFDGSIDAKHVGWIINRLYNLACYFEYAGIVHHDISPQTVFVSPEFHSAMLLGGWWYAGFEGEKIKAFPNRTINNAPSDVLRNKRADHRVDLELIRLTARELLGAKDFPSIKTNDKIPPAMKRWLNSATSGSAVTDYELWKNVLEMDFGKPRFVALNVEPQMIYAR